MDIFSFHGINTMEQLEWTLRDGGCMEVAEEFRAKGKIRFIGFSTHAHAPVIKAAISSKKFDCVNIHYHVSAWSTITALLKLIHQPDRFFYGRDSLQSRVIVLY